MKKKLKAFTLIELIVAIAVFGILMAGIVRMIEPLSSTASSSAVLNNQRNVENAIVTYLGENLRYASNLAIIKGGTPDNAVQKFIDLAPSDYSGKQIDYTVAANKDKIRVIAFDGSNDYTYKNNNFTGRLISTIEGKSGSLNFGYSNLSSDGTKNQYLVFGDEYYAQGDYFLDARICNGTLCLTVDSDYYYNPSKSSRFSSTSTAPTKGTYELRCMTDDEDGFVFACFNSSDNVSSPSFDSSQPATVTRTDKDIIYFVYTYGTHEKSEYDYVTNNGTVGAGTPGGAANCPSLDSSSSGGSGSGSGSGNKPSGGNNSGNNSGNSGNNGGNSGGNSGSSSGGSSGGNASLGDLGGGGSSGGNSGGDSGDSGNSGSSGGSSGGSSTPADLGNISVDNIVTGNNDKGVRSATQNPDGSVSLVIGNDAWNTVGMKITTNDDGTVTYTMTFTGEGNKYILDQTIFPELYANNSYTLNQAQMDWLSNNYGIHFK